MREKKDINVQIGNQIRIARERAGLTQEEFGHLVSLGSKNVSDIERGVVGIAVSTLKRICEQLSISSDFILFGDTGLNDVDYLANRVSLLPKDQFEAIQTFLNQVLCLFAKLESPENHD